MKTSPVLVGSCWQAHAQCARSSLPLTLWDVETERPAAQLSLAQTLCHGCPVAAQCAAAALASQDTGQIRAGIPLSAVRQTPAQAEALAMVAAGAPMVQAGLHIAQADRYSGAIHTLWSLACAGAHEALIRAQGANTRGVV